MAVPLRASFLPLPTTQRLVLAAQLLVLALAAPVLAAAEPLTASYLHCGARQRTTLDGAVTALGGLSPADVLVLAGIQPGWAPALEAAWRQRRGGGELGTALGTTGGDTDRLLLLWDPSRLELRNEEVERMDLQAGGAPAPLVARLRDRASGVPFLLVAASFEGTKGEGRALAAIRLVELAEEETEPIVLLANLDRGIRLDGTERDGSLGLLTDGRTYEWVRPKPLQRTDCHLDFQAGVREFLLVARGARDWSKAVRVDADVDDWCDRFSPACCWSPPRCRECGPWHLPIVASFEPAAPVARGGPEAPPVRPGLSEREQLLERIDWLLGELEALRARVEALEQGR